MASYTDSCSLLQTEFGGVDLPAAFEVHPDSAAPVAGEDTIDVFRAGNWTPVDLHNDVAVLQSDLLLHSIADPIDHGALATLNLVLSTYRGRERDQLDLA